MTLSGGRRKRSGKEAAVESMTVAAAAVVGVVVETEIRAVGAAVVARNGGVNLPRSTRKSEVGHAVDLPAAITALVVAHWASGDPGLQMTVAVQLSPTRMAMPKTRTEMTRINLHLKL